MTFEPLGACIVWVRANTTYPTITSNIADLEFAKKLAEVMREEGHGEILCICEARDFADLNRIGYLRKDDEGHWYTVPAGEISVFDAMQDKIQDVEFIDDPNVFDNFERRFGRYRTGAGIEDIRVILPKE